jgi:outer membrane receptor protein involved in Fe transport
VADRRIPAPDAGTTTIEEMLRICAAEPTSVGGLELQYLSTRRTLAGATVAAASVANATFNAPVTHAFDLSATLGNLFNQQFADPASTEHIVDSIQQNGRTMRIGLRWNLGAQ